MNNQFIKVKFLKDDKPYGRAYTYKAPEGELYRVGDLVQINESAVGIVADEEIDIHWLKNYGTENIKEIFGRVQKTELIKKEDK